MAVPLELLTVQEAANVLRVSAKTIRRRIRDGVIAAHRIGSQVRVNAANVTRLLVPINDNGIDCAVPMQENNQLPQLHRQRGRDKNWTSIIDGVEISLDTDDAEEAARKLAIVAQKQERDAKAPQTGRPRNGPWSVLKEKDRGFMVLYYDEDHHRRKHRIPTDLNPPVTCIQQAEAYAEIWYSVQIAQQRIESIRAIQLDNVSRLGASDTPATSDGTTFHDVAKMWTSGELSKKYPDHVRKKRSSLDDKLRLEKYAYGVIGDVPMTEFVGRRGLELVEQVSTNITIVNPKLRAATRRQILQAVNKVLNLAVFPLKFIERNPLPDGFIPSRGKKRARVCLFPDEERLLLACPDIPIQWRLFIGILTREGLRESELLSLEWNDVDLERGIVNLDKNKTDDPRSWVLNPSVTEALSRWRKLLSREALKANRLIVHPKSGRLFQSAGAAKHLRKYARKVGLQRPQLYEKSEERMPLRVLDLRATFVTVSLALGQSETWVTDRTGHRSSIMLYTYKRTARTYQELALGPLAPLHESIPELEQADG